MGRTYDVDYDEAALMGELDELDEEIVSEQLGAGLGMPSYIPNSAKVDPTAEKGGISEEQALAQMMN